MILQIKHVVAVVAIAINLESRSIQSRSTQLVLWQK